jgi:hypothetical protein
VTAIANSASRTYESSDFSILKQEATDMPFRELKRKETDPYINGDNGTRQPQVKEC